MIQMSPEAETIETPLAEDAVDQVELDAIWATKAELFSLPDARQAIAAHHRMKQAAELLESGVFSDARSCRQFQLFIGASPEAAGPTCHEANSAGLHSAITANLNDLRTKYLSA